MKRMQMFGGFAALYLAGAYLVGMILFLVVLDYASIADPAQKVALLVEKQAVIFSTNLLMYVLFGFGLICLTLALYDRLEDDARGLARARGFARAATAVGLIWAGGLIASGMLSNAGIAPAVVLYGQDPTRAAQFWLVIETVAAGLSGGNGEILGGVFTLLVSVAGLRSGRLPKGLNILGLLAGSIGILSILPGLNDLVGLFGISQMVWFVWLGLVLLRRAPAVEPAATKTVLADAPIV